jgi:hypothetical protein
VRTWAFSIASKRAQDHQNRSPDVKVMHVLVLGFLLFLLAGYPGLGRMSGLPGRPGYPAVDVQKRCRNVGCAHRVSGTWPDVRGLKFGQMSGPWPDVRALARCPGPVLWPLFFTCVCVHFSAAGCLALARMSGPALSLTHKRLVF